MKKIARLIIAGTLVCGAGSCFAQQDKNPNQQQQQDTPKNQPPPDNAGQNAPGQSSRDVPSQKPGTNNPDIAPDSKPAMPSAAAQAKKKTKRRKHTSSSTHTAPTP